jgi:heptosyltransferase I
VRVLIVKLSSIGDVVHALPAAALIRREMPDAEISWVVESSAAEMIRVSPAIDNLIEIDTRSMRGGKVIDEILLDISRQAKRVRQFKYDVAIDLQGLLKSAAVAKISGAPRRWGFPKGGLRESAARFLYTHTAEPAGKVHVIEKNVRLAAAACGIGWADVGYEFPIAINDGHRLEAAAIIEQSGGGAVALLNPGGGWPTKLWPAERFGELADILRDEHLLTPVIVIGPGEEELAARAAAASRNRDLLVARPSLKGFYELARASRIYIGGDTGPTHIAVAAGVPVVGLFGPTEWWRNGSTNPDDICVERDDIGCRVDCHRRKCGNWICFDISVKRVAAAVTQRLGATANAGGTPFLHLPI